MRGVMKTIHTIKSFTAAVAIIAISAGNALASPLPIALASSNPSTASGQMWVNASQKAVVDEKNAEQSARQSAAASANYGSASTQSAMLMNMVLSSASQKITDAIYNGTAPSGNYQIGSGQTISYLRNGDGTTTLTLVTASGTTVLTVPTIQ